MFEYLCNFLCGHEQQSINDYEEKLLEKCGEQIDYEWLPHFSMYNK